MAFSPDGRMLATSGQDDLIILWNAVEWTQLRTLRGHTNTVTRLAWSPDSTTLASISYDDTIRFWDAAGGQEVRRIANGRPMDIDWSNDGWFAVAMSDHTVAIYDSAGAAAQTLTGHAEMVGSVAFSPDGRFLISRSLKDYQMILWDTATWQPLLSIDAVDGPVLSLAWRPDNRLLAAGTYNDNLVLIDTRAGAIVHTFDGAIVHDLAWSPDGKVLAAGTGSGITVWDLSQALP
jgi:WD40 repeat protein